MNDLQRRKLLRIKVERENVALERDELVLISEYNREMATMLQIGTPDALDARTGRPLVSLKILLSVYRRVRTLADYRNKGKAMLPSDPTPLPRLPTQQSDLF